jgi:hypothetical protein
MQNMTDTDSASDPQIPNVAPLVEKLVAVATDSLQRNGDKALDIWKQITSGDYEAKHAVRDTATFWAEATKDMAKVFVLVRDFLADAADESEAEAAQ